MRQGCAPRASRSCSKCAIGSFASEPQKEKHGRIPFIGALSGARPGRLRRGHRAAHRLDLWAYDLKTRHARLLVDSRALAPVDAKLSDEELGRRERQRTAALSGILEYSFAPSGHA